MLPRNAGQSPAVWRNTPRMLILWVVDILAHISRPWDEAAMEALKARCSGKVRLTFGPALPVPAEFEILVAGKPTAEELDASPRLHAVVVPWAGVHAGLFEAVAARPGVTVHNIHHNAVPVAEMTVALLLAVAKKIVPFDRALRRGDWSSRYEANPSTLIHGKTVLVLGLGAVGSHAAAMCRGLGMKITGIRRNPGKSGDAGFEVHGPESLRELLPRSDVLLVCLPRTRETAGMVGGPEIALLPGNAIIVNVGRGNVVDEKALFDALSAKRIAGAGLDVWYRYPESAEAARSTMPSSFPFHELDNVVLSPHRAGHVEENDLLRSEHLADLLCKAAETGEIPNRVYPEDGY